MKLTLLYFALLLGCSLFAALPLIAQGLIVLAGFCFVIATRPLPEDYEVSR